MSTTNTQLPQLARSFFEQVTLKHAPDAKILKKSESVLMKMIGLILKPFNPRFMSTYITTIGKTIYVPDGFLQDEEARCLGILAHETQHIIDYQKNPVWFSLSYLFPQCLAALSVFGLFGFLNPLMFLFLLALVFLAPLPAPFRYQWELNGYRVSILLGRVLHRYSPSEMDQVRERIKKEMTSGSYYFAWPFPTKIDKDLKDESFILEPRFQELIEFLRSQKRIS
jgi:hypothetical protein